MANEKDLKQARVAFDTLCATLDAMEWKYQKNEEELQISFGVNGDDLPMNFIIVCDAERQLVRLMSMLDFKIPEDKRVDGAIATCEVNYKLADGSFDYDLSDGMIVFRLTASFRESLVGQDLFAYMIHVSTFTVDKYNDLFFMLGKGVLSIGDFIEKINS